MTDSHLIDPQGLAYERAYDPRHIEIMEWLISPDGGGLLGQCGIASHIAREIVMGRCPHVRITNDNNPVVVDLYPAMITTDGGKTWRVIK